MIHLTKNIEHTHIDNVTGEIKHSVDIVNMHIKKSDEPPYIKVYFEKIALWHSISNSDTLMSILSYMDYDNNIAIDTFLKNKIIKECNITKAIFEYTLDKAIKSKLFVRLCRGRYLVNVDVINKGKWDMIKNSKIKEIFLTCKILADGTSQIITTISEDK